jgi:hypothetical protein
MEENHQGNTHAQEKILRPKNGKLYFSKKTERKVFFVLTLIMLLWGIFTKLGLF